MTISIPCAKVAPHRLKLIFTPDPAKPASLRLEIYSLRLFANIRSRGFILLFTPGPKESNRKVLHEPLKMTISGHCVRTPPRRLKLIFTTYPAKPANWNLEIYSLGLFEIPQSRRFIVIFTPGPKESNKKAQHNPRKMAIFGSSVKIQARRLKLFFTPDQAKPASLRL